MPRSARKAARSKGRPQGDVAELATMTDLSGDHVRAVTDAVNPLIADALALYLKLKNYHWHLTGPRFRDFHLMFDEFAAGVLNSVDVMAERVRRVGGTTLRSVGHVSRLQTIGDDDDDFVTADDMIRRLLADEESMAEHLRKAIETCEDADDGTTANELEEILDEIERQKWFLSSIAQGGGEG